MAKDNTTNYAVSSLNVGIGPTDSSFTLVSGGGTTFPSVTASNPAYFLVSIDTEIILCSARSGDSITVAQRGWEGTTAANHSGGATVTHAPTAGMLNHLWSNVADGFFADVPPYARSGPAPSSYDDEFESQNGAWVVNPSVSGGDTIDFNVVKSCLHFRRADFSNISYVVYKPFTPPAGQTWFAMAKISHGARIWGQTPSAGPASLECGFFVSDQTIPSGTDSGNIARIDNLLEGNQLVVQNASGSNGPTVRVGLMRGAVVTSGAWTPLTYLVDNGYLYYKLLCSGGGTYQYYVGDGYTWKQVAYNNKTIAVATIGFRFYVAGATNIRTEQEISIDWLRCSINGSPAYTTPI